MSKLLQEVRKSISEAASGHNDGWVTEHHKKELREALELIEKFFTPNFYDHSDYEYGEGEGHD